MMNASHDSWSLRVGRWGTVEVRLHLLTPLVMLVALLLTRGESGLEVRLVGWGLLVLFASCLLHELVRVLAAVRVGGRLVTLVLAPIPGLSNIQLPTDPPAHLLTALAIPVSALTLMLIAACGLALGGDRETLRLILHPTNPQISYHQFVMNEGQFALAELAPGTIILTVLGQLFTWLNACLLLLSLLPMRPCAGAEILRGLLWPVLGRGTASAVVSTVALVGSLLLAMLALLLANSDSPRYNALVPSWFPLSVISVALLYSGRSTSSGVDYEVGLAIDELDSDEEIWSANQWVDESCEAVLVEHLQDKQQEALDRKRRQREASEDARVDAILARLHHLSYEELSEEDRACLKRASRRYQRRRTVGDSEHDLA